MPTENSIGSYKISFLLDRKPGGISVVAFCPICDRAEESREKGQGQQEAVAGSIAKVRQHMRVRHRIRENN